MRHRSHLSAQERQCRSRLARIAHDRPLLKGGLVTMSRTCGKKGCKCNQGERHVSLYLSTKVDGKPKMIFVPSALEKQVRAWVQNYREAAAILEEVSGAQVGKFLAAKTQAKAQRKSAGR